MAQAFPVPLIPVEYSQISPGRKQKSFLSIFTFTFYLLFKNPALRRSLTAFPKVNTAVPMILCDISRYARNRYIEVLNDFIVGRSV